MKTKLITGGTVAVAAITAAILVGSSAMATTAAMPATADHVVAAGVTSAVAELEAKAAAEKAAAEKAAAEKAAAEKAAAEKAAAQRAAAQKPAAPQSNSSRPSTSDRGIAASAYTGSYYNAAHEATRKCIVRKESGGNYGIVSSNGMYHGAYQFSRSTGDATARKMGRADLVGTPVSKWTRAEQDQAFWTLWNNGAGRGNWPTARGC